MGFARLNPSYEGSIAALFVTFVARSGFIPRISLSIFRKALGLVAQGFQARFRLGERRIDFDRALEFHLRVAVAALSSQQVTQLVMGNVIVRTERDTLAVKRYGALAIGAALGGLEIVAKRAIAVGQLFLFRLLGGLERFDLSALARDLRVLLFDQLRLLLQRCAPAGGEQDYNEQDKY
jgi:hypothetical protein